MSGRPPNLSPSQREAIDNVTSAVSEWRQPHDNLNLYISDTVYADGVDNPLAEKLAEININNNGDRAKVLVARFVLARSVSIIRALETGFVENNGDWEATQDIEAGLEQALAEMPEKDYKILNRRPNQNRYLIEPGVIRPMGYIAIRRHRPLYETRRPLYAVLPHKQGVYEYPNIRRENHGHNIHITELGQARRIGGEENLVLVELAARGFKRSAFALDATNASRLGEDFYKELEAIYALAESQGVIDRASDSVQSKVGYGQHYSLMKRESKKRLQAAIDRRDKSILLPAATGYVHTQSVTKRARKIPAEVMQVFTDWSDDEVQEAGSFGRYISEEQMRELHGKMPGLFTLRE